MNAPDEVDTSYNPKHKKVIVTESKSIESLNSSSSDEEDSKT